MNEQEKKDKIQKAQEDLLQAILIFFKKNQNSCYTAGDIIAKFKVSPGYNNSFAHGILWELAKQGKLDKCEGNTGYKYKG